MCWIKQLGCDLIDAEKPFPTIVNANLSKLHCATNNENNRFNTRKCKNTFGVSVEKFLCPRCRKIEGEEVPMIEKYDMVVCPKCQTKIIDKSKSPLGRYMEEWKRNAEEAFPLLRPPIYVNDLENPKLYFLYENCYHTLLIGQYNASIVLMGVLLEALMKERIWLKIWHRFSWVIRRLFEQELKENYPSYPLKLKLTS